MEHHCLANLKFGFTLAEVLITLGIIGVVAALTIQSLVTNIRNKGYVEGLKKNYSVLQQVTNEIIQEEGTPDTWVFTSFYDSDNSRNSYIVSNYVKHLQTRCYWLVRTSLNFCDGTLVTKHKYLNGLKAMGLYGSNGGVGNGAVFSNVYPIMLYDGTIIGINFYAASGQQYWGTPPMHFIIDVNGWKGPNVVGRDVFFLYMKADKSGKILPYISDVDAARYTPDTGNSCAKDKKGFSCAYKVITEGGMNY